MSAGRIDDGGAGERAGGACLLLMDLQEGLCRADGRVGGPALAAEVERRGVLAHAASALARCRDARLPVLHARVAFDAGYTRLTSGSAAFGAFRERRLMLADSAEAAIVGEVAPLPDEPVVDKGCVNPFVGTRLLSLLLARRVDHLLLGGVATNHVVEGTARHASDLGYRVTVLEDLCASRSPELHDFSITSILPSYAEVRPHVDALDDLLGAGAADR